MLEALTKKKTMAGGETVVMNYKMADVSCFVIGVCVSVNVVCVCVCLHV